jgi:DNA-binding LytR/AlgR family response regulator
MHIAVCDDNIADRKHTERLLGRQSDRIFKETGERIYIDSYGNASAFMNYPQMYDGLFIDMIQEDPKGTAIAQKLLDIGLTKPIIMLVSAIDYRKEFEEAGINAPNIFFMDKPIKVAEITAMVDEIKRAQGDPVKTIELRGKEGTIYATGDNIVCVKREGPELRVYLADGREIQLIDQLYNFYDQCIVFPQICPVSDNGLVNVDHVSKNGTFSVTMDNNVTLKKSFYYRHAIDQARELSKKN